MICPSMPIPASTELTEFLYISCRKKSLHPLSAPPLLVLDGGICPLSPSLPAATAFPSSFNIIIVVITKSFYVASIILWYHNQCLCDTFVCSWNINLFITDIFSTGLLDQMYMHVSLDIYMLKPAGLLHPRRHNVYMVKRALQVYWKEHIRTGVVSIDVIVELWASADWRTEKRSKQWQRIVDMHAHLCLHRIKENIEEKKNQIAYTVRWAKKLQPTALWW